MKTARMSPKQRMIYLDETLDARNDAQQRFENATLAGDDADMEYWSRVVRLMEANINRVLYRA